MADGAAGIYERRSGLSASSVTTCRGRDKGEVEVEVAGGAMAVTAVDAGSTGAGVDKAVDDRFSNEAGVFATFAAEGRGVDAEEGGWWLCAERAASSSAR